MRTKEQYKNKFRKKSRLEILKSWMTSFVITASAVVVAVIAIPQSPKAEIKNVQVFKNQVVYQVEITDADNAIQSDSLEAVLENQFEHYVVPLDLGVNVGEFSGLKDGTTYQLYILGDKGFGLETLASQKIVTESNSGAAIINYHLLDSTNQFDLQYEVDTILHDELNEYLDVQLYYGVIGVDEPEPFEYFGFVVTDGNSTHLLDNIFQSNGQIHVYIEATLNNNEKIKLDEIYINIPISFEAYYYVEQVSNNQITVSMYPDFTFLQDTVYEYKLIKDGITVSTQYVDREMVESAQTHYGYEVVFDGLKSNTKYILEVEVTYTNPYTLAQETLILDSTEVKTLYAFTYQIDIIDYDSYYEVTIRVTDPNHNFQIAYFYLYEVQDEFDMYVSSGEFGFTPIDDYKTVTFTIDKQGNIPFRIDIGLRNETMSTYYSIVKTITVLE